MSSAGLDTSFFSLIATIITGIIVAVLYISTRFGKGETKGAVIHTQTTQISRTIDEIQDQFKENQKELRTDLRDLSKEVQQLTNTLNLQTYTNNEIKSIASDLEKRVYELEKKLYELERRVSFHSSRLGGNPQKGSKPGNGDQGNGGNSSYWCL